MNFATPLGGSAQGVQVKYDPNDPAAAKAANILARDLPLSGIPVVVYRSLPDISQEFGVLSASPNFGHGKIRVYVGSK